MSDLDLLREVGQRLRQPSFDEIVDTRRRRTLHLGLAVASAAAVVAITVVGALLANGDTTRAELPPVGPSETPTTTPTTTDAVDIPAGQQTIAADIAPSDILGYEELATVTNGQPEHAGDTYLETTVTAHKDTEAIVYDCQAHDVPTWIAYADGDLVSDSPGGATDGWTYRDCDSSEPLSLELHADLTDPAFRLGPEQKTVRMFALAPPTAEQQECLLNAPSECAMPEPITATDAEFGFRIYEHAPAPLVLQLFEADNGEPYQFEALGILDGTAWLVDRAVVAAPHADRLVVEVPASDDERLVDVYDGQGPGFERCLEEHQDDLPDFESTNHTDYEAAVAEVCYAEIRLIVDGTPVDPAEDPHRSGHFMSLGARLAPGIAHQVVVEIVRGDPHNISYAVVLRTRTATP